MLALKLFLRNSIVVTGLLTVALLGSCQRSKERDLTQKDTLIYIMAGQSNMAGRALVEAQDTITNPRILSLDGDGSIVLKTEPNQLNQGGLAGLDCGISFGEHLLMKLPESTYVCLVQCSIS